MILCASILSNKSLMEEATNCLFRTSYLRVGKSAFDEYDQYAVYLAMLNHGAIRCVFCLLSLTAGLIACNSLPAQQFHTSCHS